MLGRRTNSTILANRAQWQIRVGDSQSSCDMSIQLNHNGSDVLGVHNLSPTSVQVVHNLSLR